MKEIIKLEVEHFIIINEDIHQAAVKNPKISYGGYDEFPVKKKKLIALVDNATDGDIIELSAYYLKNIILLQSFADGNHRTAITAVEFFLDLNGKRISYTIEEIEVFQREFYRLRFEIYKSYDDRGIWILSEPQNSIYDLCKHFVEDHLA